MGQFTKSTYYFPSCDTRSQSLQNTALHLHLHSTVTTSMNLAVVNKSMHVLSLTQTQPRPYLPRLQKEPKFYRLQKQLEEMLGQCWTLVFLTNETSVLGSFTVSNDDGNTCFTCNRFISYSLTPIFNAISQAGVKEFKSTTKNIANDWHKEEIQWISIPKTQETQ